MEALGWSESKMLFWFDFIVQYFGLISFYWAFTWLSFFTFNWKFQKKKDILIIFFKENSQHKWKIIPQYM